MPPVAEPTAPADVTAAFNAFIKKYGPESGEAGARAYFRDVLKASNDEWQDEVVDEFAKGTRQIAIASCHGPGKTYIAAGEITRRLATYFPLKVAVTAPTKGQLEDALLAEIVSLMDKHWPKWLRNLFTVTAQRIEFTPKPTRSFATFRTARDENPEALQGVHQDEGWVLLVADEASGVGDPVFLAAGGSMSGERCQILLLGNPTKRTGYFADCFGVMADQWWTRHVAYTDSSRVDPLYVESIKLRYGEHSNAFRVRCLGQFPLGDEDSVIDYGVLLAARGRRLSPLPDTVPVWGLDVAEKGGDRSVLFKRLGPVLAKTRPIRTWRGEELSQLVSRIVQEWHATPMSERPSEILVDNIGVGAMVAQQLQVAGLPARSVNVAEAAAEAAQYLNRRAELWFRARELFTERRFAFPADPVTDGMESEDLVATLMEELSAPTWRPTPTGKVQIESTRDISKKLRGDSPDLASAFLLTLAGYSGSGADVRASGGPMASGAPSRFKTGRAGRMR